MERTLLAVLLCGLLSQAPSAASRPASPRSISGPHVVRIYYDRPSRISEFARDLDVWEVQKDLGYVVALVEPRDYAELRRQGLHLEVDQNRTDRFLSPPGFPCYSDVDGLNARIDSLAAAHPAIAETVPIGSSWLGEEIRLLRLTNRSLLSPKPVFFLMAAIHAREMTTAEVALIFAEYLASGYGTDPDATWLLDHHEVHVVPVANPDGRRLADLGYFQRKNRNDDMGLLCDSPPTLLNQAGVDLNRNSSFKWNCCGGSSAAPCAQTYHGTSPASEPETTALQNWVLSVFPDQRGTRQQDAAPLDATGILVSLHSYSRLVLWPWGSVFNAAPNGPDLELIGTKFASYNGYTPEQSSDLYITDGTTDEWAYGDLGVASFTFEMGDDFFEDCAALPGIEQSNLGALLYAARIARTPYRLVRGPDVTQIAAAPVGVDAGTPVQLTATVTDVLHGGLSVSGAWYFLDTPPWLGGTAVPMAPSDGSFNSQTEGAAALLETSALSAGRHIVFISGVDSAGNVGPVRAVFVNVSPTASTPVSGLDAADAVSPGQVLLTWDALPGALSYRVAAGSIGGLYDHTYIACGITSTSATVTAAGPQNYFLVEAVLPGPVLGGFGPSSGGVRRPGSSGPCP